MLKRQWGAAFTAIKGPTSLIPDFWKKEGRKISFRAIARSLLCNWIWQYVNVQAVSMPPLPTPLAHRWPTNRGILVRRGGGRQEVRVAGGRLFSSSQASQESGHRLESDVQSELSTPSPLPPSPPPSPSFLFVALSPHRPSLLLHLPPPGRPPAPSPVQPRSLSGLSRWIGISGEGMDAVSLNWVKWGDDSRQWSHTPLPSLSQARHSINMLKDRRAANANRCLL